MFPVVSAEKLTRMVIFVEKFSFLPSVLNVHGSTIMIGENGPDAFRDVVGCSGSLVLRLVLRGRLLLVTVWI